MPNSTGRASFRHHLTLSVIALCSTFEARTAGAQASWRLVEELRFGTGESEQQTFSDIRGLAVGNAGQIFVLDFKAQEIRAFDASGRFVKLIARRGGGPGEISNANGLQQAPDGTIWVNDPANSRFSVFSPDGAFQRQHVIPISGYNYIWTGFIDVRGRVNDPVSANPKGGARQSKLRRFSATGVLADSVDIPCGQSTPLPPIWHASNRNGSSSNMSVPFSPVPQVVLDPRGFAWCTPSDVYRVVRTRIGQGDTVAVIDRKMTPIPIPTAQRDAEIARIDSVVKRYETSDVDFSKMPKMKPAVLALDVDDAGRLWVRRPTNEPMTTVFDVFDERGRVLATVAAPFRISAYWHPIIRGDVMYTVALDEDDVPNIVRARIRP